jgi:two-component system, sporulation sensor kinase D
MQITDSRNFTRWFIIIASFLIVVLIVWNTYYLFQTFRTEERNKMELWANATEALSSLTEDKGLNTLSKIAESNNSIPIIVTDAKGKIINSKNVDEDVIKDSRVIVDSVKAYRLVEEFKAANGRLTIEYLPGEFQYGYYGNSFLLNQLKYYPIALLLIIVLFATVVYIFFKANKMSTQNRLWAGMAKETAHQIGTPLSSLLGWVEIMKADNVDETTVTEIEKDVHRLQSIAERFSKIGSEPVLMEKDIVEETQKTYEYLRSRASDKIDFSFKAPSHPVKVMLNPELHSWTIENLVKNAIDAMKGKGKLSVIIEEKENIVKIKVCDSGKGIPKAQFKKVFEPGFTTKKRGWGLGLSLTRRIVEEYHKGKIKVLSSEVGKGTIMQASYKTI